MRADPKETQTNVARRWAIKIHEENSRRVCLRSPSEIAAKEARV
jgi:hypothetical protein